MGPDVRKNRFYNGYTLGIYLTPLFAIYLRSHGLDHIAWDTAHRNIDKFPFCGLTPGALDLQLTTRTVVSVGDIPSINNPAHDGFFHIEPEEFSVRAKICITHFIVLKVCQGKSIYVPAPVFLFTAKPWIAVSEPLIRDTGTESLFIALVQIRWAVIIAVYREGFPRKVVFRLTNGLHILFRTLKHWRNKIMILSISKGFRMNNHLVLGMHQRLTVISTIRCR